MTVGCFISAEALLPMQPGRTVASYMNWDPICIQIKARENCQQSGIKNIYGSYWHDVCVQAMETEYKIEKLQQSVGEWRQTAMTF